MAAPRRTLGEDAGVTEVSQVSGTASTVAVAPREATSPSSPSVDWPLVDHWNGTSWQVLAAPQAGSASRFTSVSALSATDVWAAGSFTENGVSVPFADHWNGTSWQVVRAPQTGSASAFTSMTALSGPDVWAAGSFTQGGVNSPFVAQYGPGPT